MMFMKKGLTKYFFAAAISIFFIGVTLDPLNHVDPNNQYGDTDCEWCAFEIFQSERLDAPTVTDQQGGHLVPRPSDRSFNRTTSFSARAPPKKYVN